MSCQVISSVQFSRSVVSDSLRLHGLQHARPPCQSPTPEVHPNPCPLSRWYHPTISSSVVPFSCLQSFLASGSLQISQLIASGGQSIGVSASISPSNEHTRLLSFRMDWLDRLAVQGTLKSLFQHHSSKVSILRHSAFFIVQLSHPYMTTGKTRSRIVWVWLTYRGLTLLLELASKPRWYKHRYYSSTLLEVKFWHFWLFLLETSRGSSYAWDSPGKNTGVDWHALLQGIFPIQGWNLYLLSLTLAGGFFTTSTIWEVLRGRPQGKLLHKDYCLFLKSHENSLKGFKQWECC